MYSMCHIDVEPGKTAVKTCFRANSACPCDLNMHNAYGRQDTHTHIWGSTAHLDNILKNVLYKTIFRNQKP